MRKSLPDDKEFQHILDLICALDERIMKVERIDDLLIIYANANVLPYHRKADERQIRKGKDASIADFGDYLDCA